MYYNPTLPKVQEGVLHSITHEVNSNSDWANTLFNKIRIHDPIMARYLTVIQEKYGKEATLVGLIVYRLLESQIEADELTELLAE